MCLTGLSVLTPIEFTVSCVYCISIQGVNSESTWHATATRHLYQIDVLQSKETAMDVDIGKGFVVYQVNPMLSQFLKDQNINLTDTEEC